MNNVSIKDNTKNNLNIKILTNRTYNLLFGFVILYGLILNYLLCTYGLELAMTIKPMILIVSYISFGVLGSTLAILSKKATISFIGYNLLVIPAGLVLSLALQEYGGIDSIIVKQSFLYTSSVIMVMITLGVIFPKLFEKLERILFISFMGLFITYIIIIIFHIDNIIISWIASIIYSLYIGYDIYKSQQINKTAVNAVDCAINVYVDIIVLFLNILDTLGKTKDKND